MKKNIKLIALDMDGTLLHNHGTLSKEGKDALTQLRANGVRVVIASGRPFYSIARILPDTLFDYAACANGQYIYDSKGNLISAKEDLQEMEIKELMRYLYQYPMVLSYSDGKQFCHTCSPTYRFIASLISVARRVYHKLRGVPFYKETITPLSKVHLTTTSKLCFAGSPKTLRKFVQHVNRKKYSAFFVSPGWLEIQTAGVSKGEALKDIAKLEHIDISETAAIGDGENDIPMIQLAGTGVAMGNAMNSVKVCADEIALPNSKDGAVRWIMDHLL